MTLAALRPARSFLAVTVFRASPERVARMTPANEAPRIRVSRDEIAALFAGDLYGCRV
jgi:hypothetical protein